MPDTLKAFWKIEPVTLADEQRWICRDERDAYNALGHDPLAATLIFGRYRDTRVSFTAENLRTRYGLREETAAECLRQWQTEGKVDAAFFEEDAPTPAFTSHKIMARLVRSSLQARRRRSASAGGLDGAALLRQMIALHGLTGTKRLGADGLREVITQLQGLFLPLSWWESIVFPARIHRYRKEDLDQLCASGAVFWIGRKGEGKKEGQIAFFLTEDRSLYEPLLQVAGESQHPELAELLARKGASFLTALNREIPVLPSELRDRLFDLVWEGRVANDQFAPLRLQAPGAKKSKSMSGAVGRWYRLDHAYAVAPGSSSRPEETALAWARQLLRRHTVLAKTACDDSVPFAWDALSQIASQWEERGGLTRGLFVRDLQSLQFTTPDRIADLRAPQQTGEITLLNSVDPANPYGTLLDWPKREGVAFARKPGNFLVLRDGNWVLWIENKGKKVHVLDDSMATPPPDLMRHAFRQMLQSLGTVKIKLETWNGESILSAPVVELLREMGAERDREALVFWSGSIKS